MQSIVESAPKKRGNPYRDANGKFCSRAEATYIVIDGELRHLPGKHNQKDHAGGQNKIRPTEKTPPPPNDISDKVSAKFADTSLEAKPNGFVNTGERDWNDPRDHVLTALGKMQGFDAKPTKGSVDDAVKNGGVEIHRGLRDFNGSKTSKAKSADQQIDEFKNGTYEPGTGIYGNGYYFSTSKGIATMYADAPIAAYGYNAKGDKPGKVIRAALKPDAKIANFEDIQTMQQTWRKENYKNVDWEVIQHDFKTAPGKISPSFIDHMNEPGFFAATMGYDAIRVPLMNRQTDKNNKARIQKRIGDKNLGDEIVVLNRGAVIVE